jgi:acyl dehydratase
MLSQTAVLVTRAAEESHGDPAVHPYVVGAIALGILLAMLVALVAFGGGREHS